MSEKNSKILEQLSTIVGESDKREGISVENEVYHGFVQGSKDDKKRAAKDLAQVAKNWGANEAQQKFIEHHELGHALTHKGPSFFTLNAKDKGNVVTLVANHKPTGNLSPKDLKRIIEGAGPYDELSETDKQQLEVINQELNRKKWWQFWRK